MLTEVGVEGLMILLAIIRLLRRCLHIVESATAVDRIYSLSDAHHLLMLWWLHMRMILWVLRAHKSFLMAIDIRMHDLGVGV